VGTPSTACGALRTAGARPEKILPLKDRRTEHGGSGSGHRRKLARVGGGWDRVGRFRSRRGLLLAQGVDAALAPRRHRVRAVFQGEGANRKCQGQNGDLRSVSLGGRPWHPGCPINSGDE